MTLREEEKTHTSLIGTTREGKSFLLILQMIHDISLGRGVCFLDPSDRGSTMYKVLRYCLANRIEKVCLIDPFHRAKYNVVPVINPFQKNHPSVSVANIDDTLRAVFQTKDQADINKINRYVPAVLNVLANAGLTLHESLYFTSFDNFLYEARRDAILDKSHPLDKSRIALEEVFKNYTRFSKEFLSSARRFDPFFHPTLKFMFGGKEGIDFKKMIREGWIILVNLYTGGDIEPLHARLLGTMVINELISASDDLIQRGWNGVYNLYIDEAGDYANRKLARMIFLRAKSGLRITLANHRYSQFEDKYVSDAVKGECKNKFAFHLPNPQDRLEFIGMAYGGDLADREVSYVLSGQKKQYAVAKIGKKPPALIRIADVPDPLGHLEPSKTKELIEWYINNIYKYPWYKSPREIFETFNERFPPPSKNPQRFESRKAPHGKATGKAPVSERVQSRPEQPRVPAGDEEPPKAPSKRPIKI